MASIIVKDAITHLPVTGVRVSIKDSAGNQFGDVTTAADGVATFTSGMYDGAFSLYMRKSGIYDPGTRLSLNCVGGQFDIPWAELVPLPQPPPPPPPANTINMKVFNGNWTTPYPNVNVTIKDANGNIINAGVTDANGNFTYTLASTDSPATISIAVGNTGINFPPLINKANAVVLNVIPTPGE